MHCGTTNADTNFVREFILGSLYEIYLFSKKTLRMLKSPGAIKILKDGAKALRELKKVDPRDRYVLLYPDSENVYVGMGLRLLNSPAEQVYLRAEEIAKKDILRLCLDGPKSELVDSFENQQIAAYVTSHATMTKFAHDKPAAIQFCKGAGGIGVGVVNSLVFSKAMSFENGLDLVQRRAQAMERAAKIVPNAKLRIKLRPATQRWKLCQAAIEECIKQGIPSEIAVCSVTRKTGAQVIEVAGHEKAIEYLENDGARLFEFRDVRRVHRNPQAYYSELMRPASDFIRGYISQRLKEDPDYLREPETCSIYSAVSADRLRHLKDVIEDLHNQPVQGLKVEQLLTKLFTRPQKLAQPNILVMWDKSLMRNLTLVNRKAASSAKLLVA